MEKKKLYMVGALVAGIVLTVVVASVATNGSNLQGKIALRGGAVSSPVVDMGSVVDLSGACKVTTCDLNAKLNTVLDNLDKLQLSVWNSANGVTRDVQNYLSTALGNKLDQIQLDIWTSKSDLHNFMTTAVVNKLDEVLFNQAQLYKYLSTALGNKLDLLLAK